MTLRSQESVTSHFQKISTKSDGNTSKQLKQKSLPTHNDLKKQRSSLLATSNLVVQRRKSFYIDTHIHTKLESVIKPKVRSVLCFLRKKGAKFQCCRYGPESSVGLERSGIRAHLTHPHPTHPPPRNRAAV